VAHILSIDDTKNWQSFRAKLNAIFADLDALAPGYGAALPSPIGQPNGRLFTLTSTQRLYQLQSGAWQLLA
jgi:hypothetical protein